VSLLKKGCKTLTGFERLALLKKSAKLMSVFSKAQTLTGFARLAFLKERCKIFVLVT